MFEYRAAAGGATASRAAFESVEHQQGTLARMLETQRDASESLIDMTGRLASPSRALPGGHARGRVLGTTLLLDRGDVGDLGERVLDHRERVATLTLTAE